MRAMLLVVVVVLFGCGPRPCTETCSGCCDERGECRPGNTLTYCGVEGRACSTCNTTQICSPTGACTSSGSGGGGGGATGGGGGAAGGGGAQATVFVTLRFDHPVDHPDGMCRVQTVETCVLTKSVATTRFQDLRTTSLSSCTVLQTSTDGYDADCTGKCTFTRPGCVRANGVYRSGGDDLYTCARIDGTTDACTWAP